MAHEQQTLSVLGRATITQYEDYLKSQADMQPATIRNYVADVVLFAVWCESNWSEGVETALSFDPAHVLTTTVVQYRTHLQIVRKLKPATINRALIGIRRYLEWALDSRLIQHNPARPVKAVPQTQAPTHHLTDKEEAALLRAVGQTNNLRDRTLILLMLHAGLRIGEVRTLKCEQVEIGKKSGSVQIIGKRGKHRHVPLNATARAVLREYLPNLPADAVYLFPSDKTEGALGERMVQLIVKKYAGMAKIDDLSPHDLRHRFGYRLAEANVPIHRIAQLMGHDSYNTTMIYIRGTEADLQKAVEQIAYQ